MINVTEVTTVYVIERVPSGPASILRTVNDGVFICTWGIYHKPHSIFKSKSYEFQNRNIGSFSGNDTRMARYFVEMHRDLRMRKALLATVSSAEFNTMALNSKLSKVVSYIQDKKAWEMIYVLLKILVPCLCTLRIADSNKSRMDKVFYYSRMTKISIIKSSTDLDNKELFPLYGSLYKKLWISSDSEIEEEENIDTDDPESSDPDMLENLSFSVC